MVDEHLTKDRQNLAGELDKQNLSKVAKKLRKKTHETIAKIDTSLSEHLALNTPVSALMELANALSSFEIDCDNDAIVYHESLVALLTILAIFAPHVGEYLLEKLNIDTTALSYPTVDESALIADSVIMAVQVNGKVRGEIEVAMGADEESIKAQALALESVAKFITNDIKKCIIVPNKLVSIVV